MWLVAAAALALRACSSPENRPSAFPEGTLVDLSHVYDETTIFWPTSDRFRLEKTFDGITPGTRVVILDLSGRVVRDFSDRTLWDGRDNAGRVVESGLYLYQVHAENGIVSGTVTVAK